MKELAERVLEEAEKQDVSIRDATMTYFNGNKKLVDKYGLLVELAGIVYNQDISPEFLFDEMKRRDELLFRYVRRYMKNDK